MHSIGTFFRFCPSCGRRFRIKLVSKVLVSKEEARWVSKIPRAVRGTMGTAAPGTSDSTGIRGAFDSPAATAPPIWVEESVPVVVNVGEFAYSYKCKHCGHEWSEKGFEKKGI